MARIVNEEEYAEKRNQILDATLRFVLTKGYEQMAIQDILGDLQISRGAFYHYFGSKQELLEALTERMQDEAEQLLIPIVQDPHLTALEKLQHFCATVARWKASQKTAIVALNHAWYSDDNAILLKKIRATGAERSTPLLAAIIHQGVREGVFTPSYPDQAADVVWSLRQGLKDALGSLIISGETKPDDLQRMKSLVNAFGDAVERVLGAPKDSLQLYAPELLEGWVAPLQDKTSE